jgi:tRNA pseudouridine55 synthase
MDGLLIVDKPEGKSSADIVRIVKTRLRCKTGHLGTLDPFASGVLPLCLGAATKIAQFLNTADKEYVGVIQLGMETDTGDPTGRTTANAPVPHLELDALAEIAARFHGDLLQTPPMYSALKRRGTPLYKLARQGLTVDRSRRPIRIYTLSLNDQGGGALGFRLSCSKGTYVRVLAQEIAAALGTVAHLSALRRTRFGHFRVEEACPLGALDRDAPPLIGLRESLVHLREIRVDAATEQRARQGYKPMLRTLPPGEPDETAQLIGPDGALAAVIATDAAGRWRFARVFAPGRPVAS